MIKCNININRLRKFQQNKDVAEQPINLIYNKDYRDGEDGVYVTGAHTLVIKGGNKLSEQQLVNYINRIVVQMAKTHGFM